MKLASWNIQWGRGLDGRVDLARIADTLRTLGDFDVICLQEVAINFPGLPGSRGEDQVAELAARLPGYTPTYGVATDVPDGRGGRSRFGNAIFSRLPVGQVWRHLLPWPAEAGMPSMQRVLVEAVIETDVGPLRVMTTHLEYYAQRQREAQIDAIRRLHAEACAMAGRPVLPEEETGGTFAVFPRPAAAHAPTVGLHAVDFVDRPECFDFVFLTEELAGRLVAHGIDAATKASDHQPVWVELAGDGGAV